MSQTVTVTLTTITMVSEIKRLMKTAMVTVMVTVTITVKVTVSSRHVKFAVTSE